MFIVVYQQITAVTEWNSVRTDSMNMDVVRGNPTVDVIRIHHKCEGGIEKSAPRITHWHHETCLVMTNGDYKGRIFLSQPHTFIFGFFFLLTTKYHILYCKKHENAFRKF